MRLNDPQQMAVKAPESNLLVIAGAGSGKTRVLTFRIAYLIQEKVDYLMILEFNKNILRKMALENGFGLSWCCI